MDRNLQSRYILAGAIIFLALAIIALNIYPSICEENQQWINTKWIGNFCELSEDKKPTYASCIESHFKEQVRAAHSDFTKCLNGTSFADTLQMYCSLMKEQNEELLTTMRKCLDEMENNYGAFTPDDMPDEDFKSCYPEPNS